MKTKVRIEMGFEDFIIEKRISLKNTYVIILQGSRMTTIHDLYREIETAFQFPMYFGGNWNSVDEMIRDLSWLKEDRYLIGINEFEKILSEFEFDFENKDELIKNEIDSFIDSLLMAIDYWHKNQGHSFDVYIQENDEVYQLNSITTQ